jgi:hypothetical protein
MVPDQLVLTDALGERHFIELHPSMRADQLRGRVGRVLAKGATLSGATYSVSDKHIARFTALLTEAFPGMRFQELSSTSAGTHRVQFRTTFIFNEHYYRAIAKIALHHYLVYNRREFTGHELAFDPIRRFIRVGGDPRAFFGNYGRCFDWPSGPWSARWTHGVAIDEEFESIVAAVCLFNEPDAEGASARYVRLARLTGDHVPVVPDGVWASAWVFDDPIPESGKVGERIFVPCDRAWALTRPLITFND